MFLLSLSKCILRYDIICLFKYSMPPPPIRLAFKSFISQRNTAFYESKYITKLWSYLTLNNIIEKG